MEKRANKVFWTVYILFCIFSVVTFLIRESDTLRETGIGGNIILTLSLLACGAAMRYWFYKNPEEVKRRFKL